MGDDDYAVVEAVRNGDTEAFRTLVDRHKHRLHKVILRLVGDPGEAEDLERPAPVTPGSARCRASG